MKAGGREPWMLCIVPSSQFSPGLRMEATMRPLRATVLRPACPATSSPQPLPRQWPASPRPPLYSPHWPIVPPCPNPRPIRWCGGAARHCALAVRAGPSWSGWTTANCEAEVHCAEPLTVFSLGKAARGSVVGWSPAWTGPLSKSSSDLL